MGTRVAVTGGVVALLLVASDAATTRGTAEVKRQYACPSTIQSAGYQGIWATSQIVRAVRAGVPRIFRDFTTQGGGPGWHHYQVQGLISLSGGYLPESRLVTRYRREAARRCGRAVALNSWVVLLQFPAAPIASTTFAHMFVAKTRHGWVAW
jgi:hypothetical protein